MKRHLVIALGVVQFVSADPAAPAGGVKLSPALQQVVPHLGEGGAHYSVTDIAGDAEKLGTMFDALFRMAAAEGGDFPANLSFENVIRDLELHRLTAMGQSAHQSGPYWHNRMFLATGGHRKGLLSLLGDEGTPYVAPGYAAADADLVMEIELNLKEARDVALQIATAFGPEASAELRAALGEKMPDGVLTIGDFLGKFDVRLSLAATLDPANRVPLPDGLTVPGVSVVARLDNAKWIWDSYRALLADGFQAGKADGLEMLMLPEPVESPLGLIQPVIALETATGSVWAALRLRDLGKAREQGAERLGASPEFQAAMKGLPEKGNALAYVSPRMITEMKRVLKQAEQNLDREVGTAMSLLGLYLPMLSVEPRSYAAAISNNAEGVLLALNGPEPIKGQSMMGSTSMIAVLAAMATPQIFKARKRALMAQNLNNAKQVGLALLTSAVDQDGRFPAELADLEEKGYLERGNLELLSMTCDDKQKRPWIYRPGLRTDGPVDQILLYGPEPSDGKRLVLRIDGSARPMREAEFQALLAEQDREKE